MSNNSKLGKQAKLAKKAGISQTHLSHCLRGERNLGPLNAKRLARLIGCDPFDWLKDGNISNRKAGVDAWYAGQ